VRTFTKPDILKSQLIIGVIKRIRLSEGMSAIFIEDEDGDLHEITVHSELLQSVNINTGVICATRRAYNFVGPSLSEVFEVLHILDGSQKGKTLTYKHQS